jgi:hypothetical protein
MIMIHALESNQIWGIQHNYSVHEIQWHLNSVNQIDIDEENISSKICRSLVKTLTQYNTRNKLQILKSN